MTGMRSRATTDKASRKGVPQLTARTFNSNFGNSVISKRLDFCRKSTLLGSVDFTWFAYLSMLCSRFCSCFSAPQAEPHCHMGLGPNAQMTQPSAERLAGGGLDGTNGQPVDVGYSLLFFCLLCLMHCVCHLWIYSCVNLSYL